jgi:hypothetical protein
LEDQLVVAPQTRAPSPFTNALGTGPEFHPSSHMAVITDSAPHPFTRQRNTDQAYTPFNTMWIQDMDKFYSQIPSMPLVLKTHDVHHQDWSTFVNVRGQRHYFSDLSVYFPF